MACDDAAYKCDTSKLRPLVSWGLRRKPRSYRSTGSSSDRSYAYDTVERESEVARFFEKCKYPVMPKLTDKKQAEAIQNHRTLEIPSRFGVLAGEIVHHLRSCLDHIIWELSEESYRRSPNFRFIEFPILETRPPAEHKFTRYERSLGMDFLRRASRAQYTSGTDSALSCATKF